MKMRTRENEKKSQNIQWVDTCGEYILRSYNKSAMRATFIVIYDMSHISYGNVTRHAWRFICDIMIWPFLEINWNEKKTQKNLLIFIEKF